MQNLDTGRALHPEREHVVFLCQVGWQDGLELIGQWGALDVLIDPYTGGIAGTVRIVVMQSMDLAVRHAQSFAAMKDALE